MLIIDNKLPTVGGYNVSTKQNVYNQLKIVSATIKNTMNTIH